MAGVDRPKQNIYLVADPAQWPERPDPHLLYHQSYEPDSGLYYWDTVNEQYTRIAESQRVKDLEDYAQLLNIGAWGGLELSAPLAAPWDLNDTFQKVDFFDEKLPGERFILADVANSTLQFDYAGMYAMAFIGSAAIVDANRGRVVEVQIENLTQGLFSDPVQVGVGRNTDVLNINLTFLFGVDAGGTLGIKALFPGTGAPGVTADGDVFEIEMRCVGDTINITTWNAAIWQAWRVSPPVDNLIGVPLP